MPREKIAGAVYVAVAPDREGSVASEALGVRLRSVAADPARLTVEDPADSTKRAAI
jgi:hypothetical protein